jgi:hypothetical protein
MKEGNKLIVRAQALDNKEESIKLACQTRSKSIPKNATIRKECVKCKKPNCYQEQHGPYYYAYWKDPESKRLKKKYIGKNIVLLTSREKKENRDSTKDDIEDLPCWRFSLNFNSNQYRYSLFY